MSSDPQLIDSGEVEDAPEVDITWGVHDLLLNPEYLPDDEDGEVLP